MRAEVNGLVFDSDFDSGNLLDVQAVDNGTGADEYLCVVRSDCEGTPHANINSSWFHFEVTGGAAGKAVILHIKTQNPQVKLYGWDMRPVVKVGNERFRRISNRCDTFVTPTNHFIITFPYTFEGSEVVTFAFTYPYSMEHMNQSIAEWEVKARQRKIIFERTIIGKSIQGRDVDCLHITSPKGREADKQIVLLSARVHPGETPGSYMLHGLVEFILRADNPISALLRQHFIFKIVPVLNPDGVALGHYRTDTNGVNLNRMYDTPHHERHPTILAMKKLFLSLHNTDRLLLYVDFHAHATKRGCFMYGNALSGERQVDNLLFAKLLGFNSPTFDYDGCNFTSKNMKSRSKRDGLSKKGTGRVALAAASGMTRCYTLEANYNTSVATDEDPSPAPYTPEVFYKVGEAVAVSILDIVGRNPQSVLADTPYGTLDELRAYLAKSIGAKRPSGSAARAPVRRASSAARHPTSAARQRAGSIPPTTRGTVPKRPQVSLPTIPKADDGAPYPARAKAQYGKSPVRPRQSARAVC